MSQIYPSGLTYQNLPHARVINATLNSITLDATGETVQFVGAIYLENPLGGSKTISAAGGGKIVWRTNTGVVFADAGTTFTLGIQDVSTTTSPGQGDGSFDVSVAYTGGGGGVTNNSLQQSVMTSGSKTIAHGDLVAMVFTMTARGGSDAVTVVYQAISTEAGTSSLGGSVISNTSGAYAVSNVYPMAYIVFDDGSIGYMYGTYFVNAVTAVTINSGTSIADEYGNYLNIPYTFYAVGIRALLYFADNTPDCELLLYSDPLGTPSVQRKLTVDATQLSVVNSIRYVTLPFTTPYLVKAYTPVAVTCRPTTANNVIMYVHDGDGVKSDKINPPNSYCYAVRRLDNTGAFSDYNGGTAKTRMMEIYLYGYHVEQGINNATYCLGI